MSIITPHPDTPRIPFFSLLPFLLITFGVAWGILGLYILLPRQMTAWFGGLTGVHPLFYLAVYAPAIAALAVILSMSGTAGMRGFLQRLLLWRCSTAWWAFLLFGIPLLFWIGSALKGHLFTGPLRFASVQSALAALALNLIKGPVEELGWRGLALPLLQRRTAPFWAGLFLGVIWGIWHLPAFLLGGTPQQAWEFTPFFAGSIAVSIIMTAMFNATRGSILLPMLFHFQLINPFWPDAQPYDMYCFLAAAVLIVAINRKSMFQREGAVTGVILKSSARGNHAGPAKEQT